MNTKPTQTDLRFAAAALRLGMRNAGRTSPNPCVAAVIVRHDTPTPIIVGLSVTAPGGRPHAETQAIAEAGVEARGATLYVTLEPCSHFGSTPPCADAVIAAGISRVVACMADPNPAVAGKGFQCLRDAGIEVIYPVLQQDAMRAHAAHIRWTVSKRPHIFLKMAVSKDGFIGRRGEGQIAISGSIAKSYTYMLRAMSDGIVIGGGTARADNPSLTCRLPGMKDRSPRRIILVDKDRLPPDTALFAENSGSPPVFLTGLNAEQIVERLVAMDMRTVMIEGGAAVAAAFLDADLIDEVQLISSGVELGGEGVPAPLQQMTNEKRFTVVDRKQLGDDTLTIYWRRDKLCLPE
ncbi:MAG: bifunctional diaminohydroxyphosphoribosylaminopyrimidine deaminase/5-amino-6-(5-phosphoribosylamino)uracil reductase RibD [Rhizobiales bacterium]|nr:bifunctional diaminohydroxyphosphoribosylaminopyrimidine deaminase/5-amino-6-(5-phosphoribosylamino)uracil reductase RibD [Hyphomicrobiales bacterium]